MDLQELITPHYSIINTKHIDSLLSMTFDYFAYDPNSAAINEIINSGQLYLIKNDVLKNQISSWSGLVEDTQRDVYIANSHVFDKLITYLAKYGSISNWHIGNQMSQQIDLRPKPTSSFEVDYQELMSSSEFENLMSWHSKNIIYILNEYRIF